MLAFRAGGFFPGVAAAIAVVLSLALVLRITLAERPAEGWSPGLAVAGGALGLLAAWTLASGTWSDAPARGLIEFDRVLLYLLTLALFGLVARRAGDLAGLLRWLAPAMALVCVVGLLSRLLPDLFPISGGFLVERLSYPLTYFNAMGLTAALTLVLAVHLSTAVDERLAVRIAAAAWIPIGAVTLYFTFSRAGIAVALLGFALYAVLARSRAIAGTVVAAGPPAALAVVVAYGADALASSRPTSAAAAAEGHRLLPVVLGCALAAGALRMLAMRLDRRVVRLRLPERHRAVVLAGAALVAAVLLAGTALATDAPRRLDEQRREFTQGDFLAPVADQRLRLATVGNNGRLALWGVAVDGFQAHPLLGTGAGTWRLAWERERPAPPVKVNDAHSLYAEVLGELGLPGLVLVLVALLTPLVVAAMRVRGPERAAYAAFVAAGTMLVLHAGADWDWEMPALFAWYFAAAGVVLAAPAGAGRMWSPGRTARLVASLGCLVIAVNPALVVLSEGPLRRSAQAFNRGDCRVAIDAALDSTAVLSVRPEPYEVLGWCDAHLGQLGLAMRAMRSARARDPGNWQYSYGLAVTQALAGSDPRAMARLAVRQNPLSALARDFELGVRRRDPAKWRAVAVTAPPPFE